MELKIASRKRAKIKMQLGGAAGSGKTKGALLLAYGMTKDWSKIAVIDSENDSASIYADLGPYYTISITDFSPETYAEAIKACEKAGIEVCIIDSSTHCWEYCVDYNSKMSGNSFQNWGVTMKKFNKFKTAMLQSPMHIISTVRKKEEYAMEQDEKGKTQVVKKGLKEIQKGEMTYEFTVVLDVDASHLTTSSKDRTGLFVDQDPFMITSETGEKILDWCNSGAEETETLLTQVLVQIANAENENELIQILNRNSELKTNPDFVQAIKNKQTEVKNA